MSDCTSISTLPKNNVVLKTTEKPPQLSNINPTETQFNSNISMASNVNDAFTELSKKNINRVVSDIQHASEAGMTHLPSRDIPMITSELTQDNQIKPNFIPQQQCPDYISQHDTYQSLLNQNKNNKNEQDKLDYLYEELQLPLLVMVLFFFFQMPFFTKKMSVFLPSLFLKDGNHTFSGYIVKTSMFGLSFYFIMKLTKYLSEV